MLWDGMLTGNFPPTFDALPLTTLNARDYVDHHFLFHVFQIPFTFFSDFQTGAKLGTWLFACLAVLSCYWLLLRNRISYPLVWLVRRRQLRPFLYRIHGKRYRLSLLVVGFICCSSAVQWLLPLSSSSRYYDMFALLVVEVLWRRPPVDRAESS